MTTDPVLEALDYLKAHKLVLTTAESCTAGAMVALLAAVPGTGEVLESGYVVYSPSAKKRLLGVSFNHTPSIMFSTRVLRDDKVRDFVRRFFVTEDYPMHVKMAERFAPLSFAQSPLVHIYYRRTAGSTYLVRSAAFDKDKLAVFGYLRDHVARGVERLLMSNRMYPLTLKGLEDAMRMLSK